MIDRQVVDGLLEKAYHLLQQGQAEQAIVLGKQLLDQRHARGFEIIALGYEQQGRAPEAIAVLRDGVEKVPNAWPLWELLGNLHSDAEDFAEAHNCYQRAMQCPNVDSDSVNYNYAVLLKRSNRLAEASTLCERINGGDLRVKVQVLKLSLWNAQKEYQKVLDAGHQLIQELLAVGELPEDEMQDLARAYSEVGRAQWEGFYNREAAWENAWKALEWDRQESRALMLVREIMNRKAPGSRWFKLVIEGTWHFAFEAHKAAPGFVATYEVVADSPADALIFAQELEPIEVRKSMNLVSQEDLGVCPERLQGVYLRSAYGFFDS